MVYTSSDVRNKKLHCQAGNDFGMIQANEKIWSTDYDPTGKIYEGSDSGSEESL